MLYCVRLQMWRFERDRRLKTHQYVKYNYGAIQLFMHYWMHAMRMEFLSNVRRKTDYDDTSASGNQRFKCRMVCEINSGISKDPANTLVKWWR